MSEWDKFVKNQYLNLPLFKLIGIKKCYEMYLDCMHLIDISRLVDIH